MKLLALSIYERFVARWLSGHTSCSRNESAQGFRPGGATFLRRLLVAFALLGVVGTAAASKGDA